MKALLVRVGIDSEYGVWNAPVNPSTGEFAYVPIPETGDKKGKPIFYPGCETTYEQFKAPCEKFGKAHELPPKFDDWYAHLDPDFLNLTYGDIDGKDVSTGKTNRSGKHIRELNDGDILVFYAGLKPIKREPEEDRLVYAIIGLYIIDGKPISAKDLIYKGERCKNAHTRRQYSEADIDIIVLAKRGGESGRLEKCIPIGKRRGKGKQYRVTEELLGKWGGLKVKDGWIQRKGTLPWFCNPEKFYKWFKNQNIQLVASNN